MYRKLKNELRRETEKARDNWWKAACDKIEEMNKMGKTDLVYSKILEITGEKKRSFTNTNINDKNGNLITKNEEIKKRWKEYVEELCNKNDKPENEDIDLGEVVEDARGPPISKEEVQEAIEHLKSMKAEGIDGIPAELLKSMGNKATK